MAALHSIAGQTAPSTTETSHVLAAMEALKAISLANGPVPHLIPLLRTKRVIYRREARGVDAYLPWWQILETSSAVKEWRWSKGLEWTAIVAQPELWATVERLLLQVPAYDDCEGLSVFHGAAVSAKRRSWVAVQEFKGFFGQLVGWHALIVIEVPIGAKVLGEVPISAGNVFVWDFPEPCVAREGFRLALVDASWLGSMERPDLGVWVW